MAELGGLGAVGPSCLQRSAYRLHASSIGLLPYSAGLEAPGHEESRRDVLSTEANVQPDRLSEPSQNKNESSPLSSGPGLSLNELFRSPRNCGKCRCSHEH